MLPEAAGGRRSHGVVLVAMAGPELVLALTLKAACGTAQTPQQVYEGYNAVVYGTDHGRAT